VIAMLQDLGGRPEATVLGRKLKLGILEAPVANGFMGHVLDYDDTHATTLHPSSPVLSALLPLCERKPVSGKEFLLAYVCGLEAGVRAGRASPSHHKGGWHLTGTLGSMAAGVGAAKLMGCSHPEITHAIGIAASQSAGLQQNRGTMTKYLHAGKAAANGLMSGLLAQRGFTSSSEVIEGARGFCRIYSEVAAPDELVADLGKPWEMERNGYKPYASAVVLHSIVDAMIQIRSQIRIDPMRVTEIRMSVHPHVVSITGVMEPANGMQSKFSVSHSAAIGLADGAGGAYEYSDERVRDPVITALRRKVKVEIDNTLDVDQARATVVMEGKEYNAFVEHQSGTKNNPMSDAEIEKKFMTYARQIIGEEASRKSAQLIWKIQTIKDVRELLALCE
jgi:2-methylcitrate dehydratase PrpD